MTTGEIKLTDNVACSPKASSMGGSQIWLEQNETLTVEEMLKAICLNSANDCVYAMAEHLAGSEEEFVTRMNNKAKDLGMYDTTFKNCHGLDEDDHLTSSYDISLMSRELLEKHPTIKNYTTIYMDTLRNRKNRTSKHQQTSQKLQTVAQGLKPALHHSPYSIYQHLQQEMISH